MMVFTDNKSATLISSHREAEVREGLSKLGYAVPDGSDAWKQLRIDLIGHKFDFVSGIAPVASSHGYTHYQVFPLAFATSIPSSNQPAYVLVEGSRATLIGAVDKKTITEALVKLTGHLSPDPDLNYRSYRKTYTQKGLFEIFPLVMNTKLPEKDDEYDES